MQFVDKAHALYVDRYVHINEYVRAYTNLPSFDPLSISICHTLYVDRCACVCVCVCAFICMCTQISMCTYMFVYYQIQVDLGISTVELLLYQLENEFFDFSDQQNINIYKLSCPNPLRISGEV